MKGILIYIDKDTLDVTVKHAPALGFLPSEETIAIDKYAQLIKSQLNRFLKEKHEPMVMKLLQMVADYNYKNNPDYAAQIDASKDKSNLTVVPSEAKQKDEESLKELIEFNKKNPTIEEKNEEKPDEVKSEEK